MSDKSEKTFSAPSSWWQQHQDEPGGLPPIIESGNTPSSVVREHQVAREPDVRGGRYADSSKGVHRELFPAQASAQISDRSEERYFTYTFASEQSGQLESSSSDLSNSLIASNDSSFMGPEPAVTPVQSHTMKRAHHHHHR